MSEDFSEIPQTLLLTEGLNAKNVTTDTKYPSKVQPYSSENLFKSTGFEVRVHWLQGTIKCDPNKWLEFCSAIAAHAGDRVVFSPGKPTLMGVLWENSGRSPAGIRVAWNVSDGKKVHGHFSMPGSYLDGFLAEEGFTFIWMCKNFGLKFTRIDLVMTDYEKRLTPKVLSEWCDAGLLRGPRQHSFIPGKVRREKNQLVSYGSTLYLGSTDSDKYTRVYEGAYLHNSDCIRWELQLRKDSAKLFADRFYGLYSPNLTLSEINDLVPVINDFARATIFGHFSFVTPESKSERLSRTEILPEWKEFLVYACDDNVIKTNPTRPVKTIEKTFKWLKFQVASSLALALRIHRENFQDYLDDLLTYGRTRHDSFHDAMVEYMCYSSD